MLQACHGQSHDHGGRGNPGVSDVKGIILCRKCPRNWCFGWGLVGIPDSSDDNNYRLTIYKRFFVCLFCFVCLLCGGRDISNLRLGQAVFFWGTARKKGLGEWVPSRGFIEVILLSFKTCHVGEAKKNFCGKFFVILWEIFWRRENSTKFSSFFERKICHEMKIFILKSCQKVATIAYKMEVCV